MTSNVTLKVATAGVDRYAQQISTQLLPGARLARLADGTGTVECHTPDGQQRTGQQYFALRNSVEDLNPARYSEMVDQLRRTWLGLGYRILEDTHGKEGDLILAVATPDDYHLTVWVYGDNRNTPLLLIESPCAWPDVSPSASTSRSGG